MREKVGLRRAIGVPELLRYPVIGDVECDSRKPLVLQVLEVESVAGADDPRHRDVGRRFHAVGIDHVGIEHA